MFSFPANFKHNFPVLYQSLMTCNQTLHWFWTNIDSEPNAGFAAVSAFTLYQSLMLSWSTQLHSPSTAGCLETVENTDPRKTDGEIGGTQYDQYHKKNCKYRNNVSKNYRGNTDTAFRSLYNRSRLLKVYLSQASMHQMALHVIWLFW